MKISIIVPAYNAEKYIGDCIQELLQQDYSNIEIITINDASSDNTINVLQSIKSPKLKVIDSNKNLGAYNARRLGVKNSSGDYIMFVDSDDYIEKDTIRKLVNYIEEYRADIVKYRFITEPKKNESPILYKDEKKPFLIDEQCNSTIINQLMTTQNLNNLATMIIKRDLLIEGDIDKRFSLSEDFVQSCYVYSNAKRILFIDDIFYHYVLNPNSTMNRTDPQNIISNLDDLLFCNKKMKEFIIRWNVKDEYWNLCNARTFNGLTKTLINKMCMTKTYDKELANSILNNLFNNKDFINLKKEIKEYKYINMSYKKDNLIKQIIKKKYKKYLYNEDIKKLHKLGQAISEYKQMLLKRR